MPMTNEELITLLAKSLLYTPIVYKQSIFTTDREEFGNEFVLEFKQTEVPDDSILLFLPSVSSVDGECKLILRIPRVVGTNYEYVDNEFKIIVEQNDDYPRPAGKGDIIANRMCIFRFKKSTNEVVLCNSPLYMDAIFSKLKVTNAEFVNKPTYKDPQNPGLTYVFITSKEYNELLYRVEKLEQRIKFGTQSPEEALANAPAGTIYIQHEED